MHEIQNSQVDTTGKEQDIIRELKLCQAELALQQQELKETAMRLENARKRMSTLFDEAPVGYVVLDKEARVIEANHTWCRIVGQRRPELVDASFSVALSEDSRQAFLECYEDLFNAPYGKRLLLSLKDGLTSIKMSASATRWMIGDHECDALLATLNDVSEWLRLQENLRDTLQIQAIAQLTSGVAHDFNNILGTILGFVGLAKTSLDANELDKVHRHIAAIQRAGLRGRDLVRQLLIYSSGESTDKARLLDLSDAVRNALTMIEPLIPASIEININVKSKVVAEIDPLHLNQMLMNLCVNARDAMNGQGTLNVNLESRSYSGQACDTCHQDLGGDWAVIEVEDDGQGMTPEVKRRIFEPFFSSRDRVKGTGLGLSVVHGMIKSYHGHVMVDTAPGEGARFQLLFPLAKLQLEKSHTPESTLDRDPDGLSGVCVLVVEDETDLREMLGEFLEDEGCKVLTAANGADALKKLESAENAVDIVITDQTMPRLTGLDLAERIKQVTPELPIILSTGYGDKFNETTISNMPVDALMVKPVLPDQLLSQMEFLLSQAKETEN